MVNTTQIAKVAKAVIKIGVSLYTFKSLGFFNKPNETQNKKTYATNYYELVEVIVNSDLLDSYKEELIRMIENFKPPGYYQAIANIVNGDMLTSTKLEMIKAMSL